MKSQAADMIASVICNASERCRDCSGTGIITLHKPKFGSIQKFCGCGIKRTAKRNGMSTADLLESMKAFLTEPEPEAQP